MRLSAEKNNLIVLWPVVVEIWQYHLLAIKDSMNILMLWINEYIIARFWMPVTHSLSYFASWLTSHTQSIDSEAGRVDKLKTQV